MTPNTLDTGSATKQAPRPSRPRRNIAGLELRLARTEPDLRGAERLRYKVFVEELRGDGAEVDHDQRLERDRFDPYFDHLILVDPTIDPETFEHVVGVYRVMRCAQRKVAGSFYSEGEYDLSKLRGSGRRLLELGRSCVAPAYRGGAAVYQLWQGLARYVTEHEIDILFGVASFPGTDPQRHALALSHLRANHLCASDLRPVARDYQSMALIAPPQIDTAEAMRGVPALIKAYLRVGGTVGDGAFIDHAFNTIDVCLVMDTKRLSDRHRQIYLQTAG